MRRVLASLPIVLLALGALANPADADPTAVETLHAQPSAFDPAATVSVEPIYLLAGIVEANLEIKVAPHVGLQVIGGYGGFVGATVKELGAEANVYMRPQLAGLHFGVMGRRLWASTSFPFATMTDDAADTEREIGAYAGWKWIGWRHLTAVLQAGVGRIDLAPVTASSDIKSPEIIPVANFVAGYSF